VKRLLPCAACGGFLPTGASACPHCGAGKLVALAKKALAVASASSVAVTLMACYGPPPRDYQKINDSSPEGQKEPTPRAVDPDAGRPPASPSMPGAK
jgi:hypothetical protein